MKQQAMNCPLESESTFDVLLDYSAGKLDRARAARLERHMLLCAECSSFLAGQTELWQTLDTWEPEPVSMDFNRRLYQRIEAETAAPWYLRIGEFLRMGAWKPAIPLAAAVVLVAAGFMMDHPGAFPVTQNVETASGLTAGVTEIDADQVEKTLDDIQLLRQLDASAVEPNSSKTM
jgi:hypothetical protein